VCICFFFFFNEISFGFFANKKGATKIGNDWRDRLQSAETEWDCEDEDRYPFNWPFFLTFWLNENLKSIAHPKEAERCDENLWGNAASFSLYYYKDGALLLQLCEQIEPIEDGVLTACHTSNFFHNSRTWED
jgi:hypothetical protein